MRTTVVLLALAVLAVVVLAACQAREDAAADSTAADSTASDDSGNVAQAPRSDAESSPAPQTQRDPSPTRAERIRSAGDSAADTVLPPHDTARALRPEMPQVTPEKRPRTWRGFKLPEERPVRAPVETIKRVEQVPDSVMKGDSTRPPQPDR
jgi:hypothetical protein